VSDRDSVYHEAGHAIVALLSKVPIGQLTTAADDISTASMTIEPIPGNASVELKRSYAYIYLAGILAELRMKDPKALACSPNEMLQSIDSQNLLGAFADDFSKVEKICLSESESLEEDTRILYSLLSETARIVEQVWDLIEAVAEALLIRRTLSPAELREILLSTFRQG
jgi:hypothetical protein